MDTKPLRESIVRDITADELDVVCGGDWSEFSDSVHNFLNSWFGSPNPTNPILSATQVQTLTNQCVSQRGVATFDNSTTSSYGFSFNGVFWTFQANTAQNQHFSCTFS